MEGAPRDDVVLVFLSLLEAVVALYSAVGWGCGCVAAARSSVPRVETDRVRAYRRPIAAHSPMPLAADTGTIDMGWALQRSIRIKDTRATANVGGIAEHSKGDKLRLWRLKGGERNRREASGDIQELRFQNRKEME